MVVAQVLSGTEVDAVARAKKKVRRETKQPRPKAASKRSASKKKGAGSDVEKRWAEYWRRRNELEEAVAQVKEARDALARLVEIERTRRSEFEQVKASLTELLDVEPANPNRPVAVPSEPREPGVKHKA
jgi:chromosome segregation ATPase